MGWGDLIQIAAPGELLKRLNRRPKMLLETLKDFFGLNSRREPSTIQNSRPPEPPAIDVHYADMVSVASPIRVTGFVTATLGFGPWRGELRKKVIKYIGWHRWKYGTFPTGEHIIESGDINEWNTGSHIYRRNLVRFPNSVPPFDKDQESFAECWPIECDAGIDGILTPSTDSPPRTGRYILRNHFSLETVDSVVIELERVSKALSLTHEQERCLLKELLTYRLTQPPANLIKLYWYLRALPDRDETQNTLVELIADLHEKVEGAGQSADEAKRLAEIVNDKSMIRTVRGSDGFFYTYIVVQDFRRWFEYTKSFPLELAKQVWGTALRLTDELPSDAEVVD